MAKRKQPKDGKRVNVYFPPEGMDILERCMEEAKTDRRSLSSWIVVVLERHLQDLDETRGGRR
jgi:hypothetical protein